MVSDFGLSRDVYESGEYENTSGVWKYTLWLQSLAETLGTTGGGKRTHTRKIYLKLAELKRK